MSNPTPAKKPFWKKPIGILTITLGATIILGLTGVLDENENPTPTPTETNTVAPTRPPATNVTEQVKNAAGEHAHQVTQALDDGRLIIVETNITDPRGDHGSQQALDAIAICEAVKTLGRNSGRILESDGTIFVTLQQGTCEEQ